MPKMPFTLFPGLAALFLLALVGAAGPAASQQRDEQEAPWVGLAERLETCAGEARGNPERRLACIGLHARSCVARPENQPTSQMEQCYMLESRAWDALLNRYYRARPQGEKGTALMAVQRAWISYRDLKCGYFSIYHDGGSIARLRAASCMMEETGRRAMELRAFRDPAR